MEWKTKFRRRLILGVLIATAVIVLAHILIPEAQAQGGSCTAYYLKYWDRQCNCYVTEKRWSCTGWQQPRGRSYGRVPTYYRRW